MRAYFFSIGKENRVAWTLSGHASWFTEKGKGCRGATEASFIWDSFGDNHKVSDQMIRNCIVNVSQSLGDTAIDVRLEFRH